LEACQATSKVTHETDSAARALRVFYGLDTPVTLARLRSGEPVDYIPQEGLTDVDLALSYTGGTALNELQNGSARAVIPPCTS